MIDSFGFFENKISRIKLKLSWINACMHISRINPKAFLYFHAKRWFLWKSSSPEPLGKFKPNLAQGILGWLGLKFVQMKVHALFGGEIFTKRQKYVEIFFKKHWANFKQTWQKGFLGERTQIYSNKEPLTFPRRDNYKIAKIPWWNLII